MNNAPVVHPATSPADLHHVRVLMREYIDFLLNHPTGSAHFCIAGIEDELADLAARYPSPGALLLAEHHDQPVGCIAIREVRVLGPMAPLHQAEGGGLALEFKRLWVRPSARNLRLGRRLMEAALVHARHQRAAAVFLDTVPAAMPEATTLYRSLGFDSVPRYNSNDLNGVAWFRLRLNPSMEPMVVTHAQNPTK